MFVTGRKLSGRSRDLSSTVPEREPRTGGGVVFSRDVLASSIPGVTDGNSPDSAIADLSDSLGDIDAGERSSSYSR